jgi:hypothetical protein
VNGIACSLRLATVRSQEEVGDLQDPRLGGRDGGPRLGQYRRRLGRGGGALPDPIAGRDHKQLADAGVDDHPAPLTSRWSAASYRSLTR